jgi:putative ABC transport system ATP-binding protein
MIRFEQIFQKYKEKELFNGLSFNINKSDKLVFTGPSGSGKSTLLNYLMGFDFPDSGAIIFENEKITIENIAKIRKRLFWLPQNINDIGEGKIRETILRPFAFGENSGIIPGDDAIKSELANNGLPPEILDSDFTEISGGEKQRVGLTIAKLLKRDVILLDEPTSALDEASISHVIEIFLEDKDLTVISVSHNHTWIENCTKNIRIGNGAN